MGMVVVGLVVGCGRSRGWRDPLERVELADEVVRLRAALGKLSEADREVLHLRHTAGLSFPEIAETLEEPLGTVLARGHRALKKLRKLMEGPEG